MPSIVSLNDATLWPTLGETLADLSRSKVHARETMGASCMARTLDRANGMERTGAPPRDQALFGGVVAGKGMDWVETGNFLPRDVIMQTDDLRRGMLTLQLNTGNILNTSI